MITRKIIEELVREVMSTGTGASTAAGNGEGVATKFAFKKKKKFDNDEVLNEVSSRTYNNQVAATPKQKAKNAFSLVRKKINEIDKILEYSNRLKEELGENWQLNEKQILFINEKMKSLSHKLKKISK